jgi:FkbM family methyltransferase
MLSMSTAQALFELLGLTEKIRCLDIGALALGEEVDPWMNFARNEGLAEVIGFEPVEEECARLNAAHESHQGVIRYLPFAIGDGASHTLRVTNIPMTSSLYEPHNETIDLFKNLGELMRVEKRVEVKTKRLDELLALTGVVDFIKLDIQGSELMALENAKSALATVGVVQCEVEFVELYQDQPLFADVDKFLRSQGFCFLKFACLMGRPYKPLSLSRNPNNGISQTLWGDAIYVKDFRQRRLHDSRVLRSAAFVLHQMYGAYDLAHLFIEELDRRDGSSLASDYRSIILGLPSQPNPSLTLKLPGDVSIIVPDSLEMITPYVLMEQLDWFEDDIKFLRDLLRPGQVVIDIGANYGVYALTMANAVGVDGRVFAFEPVAKTAGYLRQSLDANNFKQAEVLQLAISVAPGTGRISTQPQAELNALVDGSKLESSEEVRLDSLDNFFSGRTDVDFLKIDAEGHEQMILDGGRDFFASNSPLVLYEIKENYGIHLELVESFNGLGYDSYRLLPGLNILVPFDQSSFSDDYLLNIFACKQEQACLLRSQGKLVLQQEWQGDQIVLISDNDWTGVEDYFESLSCPQEWLMNWRKLPQDSELIKAIALYQISRNQGQTPLRRATALRQSFDLFKAMVDDLPTPSRLSSLARVAQAYGARSVAVEALKSLLEFLFMIAQVDVEEPFLLPSHRFDSIPPGDSPANWLGAAALQEQERLETFSSIYSGEASRERLEMIASLGFASEEMTRRLALLNRRREASAAQGLDVI